MTSCLLRVLIALACVAATSAPALAHDARNVLVVINAASPDSIRVGEHYARVRAVPAENVVRLQMPIKEEIAREEFARLVETPLADAIARHAGQDRIVFLVLTKGVPLRVAGTTGRQGSIASVDSELTLLYRKMVGRTVPAAGAVPNPYFRGEAAQDVAVPFSRAAHDIYLVTRLDGFTADEAVALVDRAQAAAEAASAGAAPGRIALDMKAAFDDRGNAWLQAAAERLREAGLGERVLLETTSAVVRDQGDLLGHYSWGSNDPAVLAATGAEGRGRGLGLRFAPGAIAASFVSTDGRTFQEPAVGWKPGTWDQRGTFHAGSPQSLAGDMVRQGVTGVAAQVSEPFLDAAIRPDILFPGYLAGLTLAEAFYRAMPSLSWQTVVLGDPLCVVAPRKLPAETTDVTALDPATQLPTLFAQRRLEVLSTTPATREALVAMLRAEALAARGETAASLKALEEATSLDTRLVGAHLRIATEHERARDYKAAMGRYRQVLEVDRNNVIALNNLAYALAVHEKQPGDALPMAERAYTLSRGNATVADTLAWVYHLLGDKRQAGRYIGEAVRGAGRNPDVRLHAAAILLAAGGIEEARQQFKLALELDPKLEERQAELVKSVRQALGG